MMVIGLPAEALANVRFRWSLLGEVPASLKVAERQDRPPWIARWWQEVQPRIPAGSLRLLRELAPARPGSGRGPAPASTRSCTPWSPPPARARSGRS